MNSVWSRHGNSYRLEEVTHQQEKIPVGVYRLEHNEPFNYFYLDHVQDFFTFPYKIYGVETDFIKRVKKTWDNTATNMGVLLNGLKGTGKTVTAELICNELELPVILVQKHYPGLVSFLNSVQQDIIVFIDEYEKIYNKYDNALLSVMDGAFRTDSRKMFLMTTNDLTIEKNMLQRPSRIRYIKAFSDLTLEVIMEVVDDKLIHPELRDCTVKMISELPIITMDLVKSVIEEVNIHHEDPALFKDIFNVAGDQSEFYDVFTVDENGQRTLYMKNAHVFPSFFSSYEEQSEIYMNKRRIGIIEKYISKTQLLIQLDRNDDDAEEPATLAEAIAEMKHDGPRTPKQRGNKLSYQLFHFEPAAKTHKAFAGVPTVFTV